MPLSVLNGISHACFGLSYLLALSCEVARLWKPVRWLRPAGIIAGIAGLFAHTIYLAIRQPSPAEPFAALLLVSWVLAVFAVYGTLHHARQLWAIFVWPVVLGLVGLSLALLTGSTQTAIPAWITGDRSWGIIHGMLVLSATVGLTVSFLAAAMYLVQAARVKSKANPLGPFRMLNLERLEVMNRRAVNLAFPFLTAGLVLGGFLLRKHDTWQNWYSVKFLSTALLWVVCFVLLYLRYARAVSAKRYAWLSIIAFILAIIVITATHPIATHPFAPIAIGGES
jgi:ABC-type transport system involved in cytochrome c biogenesis permease subunit